MALSQNGRSATRGRYRPLSEINVTPLVDVMLVLLIIFMVTAPLMTSGVSVDLPRTDAKPLNKPMMEWFLGHVIRSDQDKQDPRLDLVGKANLRDLPPATVITAEIDPLMSEGKTLADKLGQAGVQTRYQNYEGVTHEFFGMGAVLTDAKSAQTLAVQELKQAFGAGPAATGSATGQPSSAQKP